MLYGLAVALIVCIMGGGIVYLYSCFNEVISDYRREMNATTYNAQIYFDRREVMLHLVRASLIEELEITARSPTEEASHFHLSEQSTDYLQRLNLRALYTSVASGETRYIDGSQEVLAASVQDQIALFLRAYSRDLTLTELPPILWVHPLGDTTPRLFLYSPIDPAGLGIHWVGLEIDAANMFTGLSRPVAHQLNYLLLNPDDFIIAKNGFYLEEALDFRERMKVVSGEGFRIIWDDYIPEYLVLTKQMGEGGWQLLYYVRFIDMFGQGDLPIYQVLTSVLLLCFLVLFSLWQIRIKLLIPAMRQYVALQESEHLTRTVIDLAPVGLCLLDRDNGRPLFSNEIADGWLEHENAAWRTQMLEREQLATERTLEDGRSMRLEFVSLNYHGKSAILCALNDVTEMKRVEHSLIEAKNKADSANQAKSEFIATISHEIRVPLFGITGTLELLGLTELTSTQRNHLKTIQQSSVTLLHTLNETLDLSRAESQSMEPQLTDISLVWLVNSVVANYADRARGKGVLLYGLVSSDVPLSVKGDEFRLRQVLSNLVSNAIKFTVGGHITIRLDVAAILDLQHVSLSFQVTDTGVGIAQHAQEQVLNPYFQAVSSTEELKQRSDSAGTGLGLFICERLVNMMHGEIALTSAPGLGTSVKFTLPLRVNPEQETSLLPTSKVYVHGAVQEVVINLCDWMQRFGLSAVVYQPGDERGGQDALLIQAWPHHSLHIDWPGQKIVLMPPGLMPSSSSDDKVWYCNSYDFSELRRTLVIAQRYGTVKPAVLPYIEVVEETFNFTVLVVDDDAINRQVVQEQLSHLGCSVDVAHNGAQALRYLDQNEVDLIITDINMPGMSGYTVAHTLRKQGYQKFIYGITADTSAEVKKYAYDVGMDDLLIKPASITVFKELLSSLLKAKE